jgi:hypothetical protein
MIGRQYCAFVLFLGGIWSLLESASAVTVTNPALSLVVSTRLTVQKKKKPSLRWAFVRSIRGGSSSSSSADEGKDWDKGPEEALEEDVDEDDEEPEEDDEDGGDGEAVEAGDATADSSSLGVVVEQEEEVFSVEMLASHAAEEDVGVEAGSLEEEDDDGVDFQEEIIDVMGHSNSSDENDVRLMATTTDGELADDEGTDFISSPDDAVELVGVTAGGAVVAIEEDEGDGEEDGGEELKVEEAVDVVEIVEISDEMKEVLRNELHYTARDVLLMRPDIASMVVYNRLIRPTEGMPLNWYIEGAGPPSALRGNAIKIALTATVLGAIAVLSLKGGEHLGVDISDIIGSLRRIPSVLASIPRGALSAAKTVKAKALGAIPVAGSGKVETVVIEPEPSTIVTEEGTEEKVDDVVHSLKPGIKAGPKLDEDISILDKFLTAVERAVKGFFRIKI